MAHTLSQPRHVRGARPRTKRSGRPSPPCWTTALCEAYASRLRSSRAARRARSMCLPTTAARAATASRSGSRAVRPRCTPSSTACRHPRGTRRRPRRGAALPRRPFLMLRIGLVPSAHSGAGSRRAPWTPPTGSRRTTCATVTRASRASTRSATGLSWRGALPGRRVRGHAPAARAVVAAGPGRRRGPDPRHEADRKPGALRPAELGVVAASRYGGPDSPRSGGALSTSPAPAAPSSAVLRGGCAGDADGGRRARDLHERAVTADAVAGAAAARRPVPGLTTYRIGRTGGGPAGIPRAPALPANAGVVCDDALGHRPWR